jgi:ribonuclease HI
MGMNELYCDGGVMAVNPSPYGGMYAYRILSDGEVVHEHAEIIFPYQAELPTISNNLTEMMALVCGLETLPIDWTGTVFSDSQVTLGRAFLGWKWNNVPEWLVKRFDNAKARLIHWEQIQWVLLDGHPTREQLLRGTGKRGHAVSAHNVWCDKACQMLVKQFMAVPF